MGGQAAGLQGAGASQGVAAIPAAAKFGGGPGTIQGGITQAPVAGGPPLAGIPQNVAVAGPGSIPIQAAPQVTRDYPGMAGQMGQMLGQQGQDQQKEQQMLDHLATLGPPPNIPASSPMNSSGVGARLAGLLQRPRSPQMPQIMQTRGEMLSNPPNIGGVGGALSRRY